MPRRIREKIIGLDADGTCWKNTYPTIGADIGAQHWLLHIHKTYFVKYLLWTMRTGKELEEAQAKLAEMEVPIWAVNNNPDQVKWSESKKIYANVYVDDTALGMPLCSVGRKPYVNWHQAGPLLEEWCRTHAKLRTNQ